MFKDFVPAFESDKRLDSVRILNFYLKKTKEFRKEENMGLFLSVNENLIILLHHKQFLSDWLELSNWLT